MALTKKADYAFKHTAQIDEPVFATTADTKTALDSQAVELRTYINDTLTVEAEALFATKDELAAVVSGDIPDGSLSISKLDFDPATQAELNTHKTSTDHDGRYYTESEVDSLIGGKVDKSILTTAGDIIYASGASAPASKAIGSAYQSLNVNSAGTSPEYQASLQSLMTAPGDIVYASGANAPARLAKGTDGQVLTLASGLPAWTNKFGIAFVSGVDNTTSVPSGAYTKNIALGVSAKFVIVTLYQYTNRNFVQLICNSSGEMQLLTGEPSGTYSIVVGTSGPSIPFQFDGTPNALDLGINYNNTRVVGTNLSVSLTNTAATAVTLNMYWSIVCFY